MINPRPEFINIWYTYTKKLMQELWRPEAFENMVIIFLFLFLLDIGALILRVLLAYLHFTSLYISRIYVSCNISDQQFIFSMIIDLSFGNSVWSSVVGVTSNRLTFYTFCCLCADFCCKKIKNKPYSP